MVYSFYGLRFDLDALDLMRVVNLSIPQVWPVHLDMVARAKNHNNMAAFVGTK